MPCGDCLKKQGKLSSQVQFFPGLDAADTALTVGYTEVLPEDREVIDLMRQWIQKKRSESPHPIVAQWEPYFLVLTQKILPYIGCPYCRRATEIDLIAGGQVHMLFERGLYWFGFKLSVRRDLKKYVWMGKAFYHRVLVTLIRRKLLSTRTLPRRSLQFLRGRLHR